MDKETPIQYLVSPNFKKMANEVCGEEDRFIVHKDLPIETVVFGDKIKSSQTKHGLCYRLV
jgi:hypothetical protein